MISRLATGLGVGLLGLLGLISTASAQSVGIVCTTSPSSTFNLEVTDGYIQTPDGNVVYMWGFGLGDDFPVTPPSFQHPSPVLCVNEGDTVTVNLTNLLPAPLTDAVSIVFPGQTGVSASGGTAGFVTNEVAPGGGTVIYTFTANQPGTYIYESGTEPHKQVHMGLFGVVVVRPALGPNFAYNDQSTQFSDEFLLILHESDPVLHRLVDPNITPFGVFDQTTRHDRYWTINGRSMPDTVLDNSYPLLPNQPFGALVQVEAEDPDLNPNIVPILVRYANPGTVDHPFHPHGDHLTVMAQDGRLLGAPIDRFARTVAAGQTVDLLFTWTNVESWTPGSNGNLPESPDFPFPSLLNLVFKDDVTWYSGDQHLGQTGELPPAVTTFTQCGEFYFPWHSHALNEAQNFDEGFGGMLTLVRVDPPGGCP